MKYYFILVLIALSCRSYGQHTPGPDTLKKMTTVALDSVQVINNGYQVLPKDRTTGSFTQVDNKTLNLQVGSNIISRLESVASGVAFNKKFSSAPAFSVRGLSTINGPTAPLIILDNFPFEGDLNSINPDIVESITILKDATAASIWGTRAGNGVIVINTKKGRFSQPLTTEFNSTMQVINKPGLSYLHPISASDYIDMEQFLYGKGYYTVTLASSFHPVVSPVVEILDQQSKGIITAADATAKISTMRSVDLRSQFTSQVYRPADNQRYSLAFSGGAGNMSWSASGGYDHNIGSLSETYERLTARLENSFRPMRQLKISTALYFTRSNTASGKQGYTTQSYMYPYSRLTADDGSPLPVAREYRKTYLDTLGGGKLLDWNYYPSEDYKHSYSGAVATSLLATAGLQYQLTKGFSIDLKYQYESGQGQTSLVRDEQSFEARYYVNLYSQLNRQTGVVTYNVPRGGILDRDNNLLRSENARAQLNYNKTAGLHQLTALLGTELRQVLSSGESYRTYGYSPETITGVITDYKNSFPIITTGDLYSIPSENSFEKTRHRFVSFFANAAYTYNKKYSLTLSGRRDASNLFGAATNDKWTPLWSAGAGWDLAKEKFFHIAFLPALKLRATYGYTGNADPTKSAVVTIYSLSSAASGLPQMRVNQFPNPTLRWEQVAITNIGIDFAARGNRISGSIEWYQKKGTDLYALAPVDITTGLNASIVGKNVADMKGNGVDIVLNAGVIKRPFTWNVAAIFNYNTDKVTHAYLVGSTAASYLSGGEALTAIVGRPVHSVISYRWGGLDHATGNPIGYLAGKPSMDYSALTGSGTSLDDLEYNGPGLPRYFGSLTNSFSYKDFELTVNISYKMGYYFTRTGMFYTSLFSGTDRKSSDNFSRRWQQPGDETFTDVPAMIYPANSGRESFYSHASVLVEKGDHIRLQFVNLSYNSRLKKGTALARRLQLYANASNLGILWRANKRGLDPDYLATGLPPAAAYALGFRLFLQ
jgi:TonB-linked SusC/RagA family outer membrane protein